MKFSLFYVITKSGKILPKPQEKTCFEEFCWKKNHSCFRVLQSGKTISEIIDGHIVNKRD